MSVRSLRYNSLMLGQAKYRSASTDRDAAAFLEAAGVYKSDERKAINELVRLLKQYGLWSKMKAIYPFIGGTATTHKWNLKDPQDTDAAYRLLFSGGWTHSGTGALPNGTNAYANTYFSTSANALGDGSLSVYSRTNRTNPTTFEIEMGALRSLPNSYTDIKAGFDLFGSKVTGGRWNNSGLGTNAAIGADTLGFYQTTRTTTTQLNHRKSITQLTNDTVSTGSTAPTNIFIGALNNWGTGSTDSAQYYSQRELAYASIGTGLTTDQCNAHYWAVDKYQRLLSRNV